MTYLFLVLLSIALLVGFIALTEYEKRRGARFFHRERALLDERVMHASLVLTHVDFWALIREGARRAGGRISHDLAHLSLQLVRAMERLLTRLVRSLRTRYADHAASGGDVRTFIKTLSDFKVKLKETRPDAPDIS